MGIYAHLEYTIFIYNLVCLLWLLEFHVLLCEGAENVVSETSQRLEVIKIKPKLGFSFPQFL